MDSSVAKGRGGFGDERLEEEELQKRVAGEMDKLVDENWKVRILDIIEIPYDTQLDCLSVITVHTSFSSPMIPLQSVDGSGSVAEVSASIQSIVHSLILAPELGRIEKL